MLLLESSSKNKLTMRHATGKTVVFYYRDPEPEDQVTYHNATLRREGKVLVYDPSGARLAGGLAVVTGIGEGLLGVPDGKGADGKVQVRPISSDPASPAYDAGWKDLVKKHLAAELMLLGAYVFDGTRIIAGEDAEGNLQETLPQ